MKKNLVALKQEWEEKDQLVIPESDRENLRESSLTRVFDYSLWQGFKMMVVNRAVECSQGEVRLRLRQRVLFKTTGFNELLVHFFAVLRKTTT